MEVPEYNFFDVVVSTRKELKDFVDALPNPGIYTKERPLVVGMKPGNYGRLWFGGGYNQAAEESISHKLGGDLHIHLQSTGTERPEIDGVIMGDWINPVKYLGFTSVRINNHEDRPAPFTQLVHSKESSGYLILDDVILAGDGTNNYGGEGLKWGIKPSSLEGLVVRNVWNLDGPEEHTAYIYGCRGPLQITDVHMTENIGNRTFSQLRWPYAITTQSGDVLYSCITLKGQGQDYAHANGGSTLTFWGAPQSIQKMQDIRVTDSRYGCLRVVGDPEAPVDKLLEGKYHHKHFILEDCLFENKRGDRDAVGFSCAAKIEFRGANFIEGDLQFGSKWASTATPSYHPVREFILNGTLDVTGHVYEWDADKNVLIDHGVGKDTAWFREFFNTYNEKHKND